MELKFFDSAYFNKGLKLSSNSERTVELRKKVYFDAVENLNTLRSIVQRLKYFDDASAMETMAPSQMGVALAEATLKANINSIAGYIAIERSMTQMQQNLVYRDIVTKVGASVMPLIGEDNPRSRAAKIWNDTLTAGETDFTVGIGTGIVPGRIAITLVLGSASYDVTDDRKGNLLAPAGVLAKGTVDYTTGEITFSLATAAPADSTMKVCYQEDRTLEQGENRTTLKQGYFNITAKVNKFEFEQDLITAMISQKTVGGDVVADLQQSVYDEQVLSINNQLVDVLRKTYEGSTLTIDLSAFSIQGGFFTSLLQVFNAGLAAVDNAIAERCYKVVAANAYVVGNGLATFFQSLEDAQGWVANNTGYVNGLIGFYKGRAVIRHLYCDPFEGYAIHKTADGQLAPLGYGILLPATNLPLIGNFAATNEVAGGIYSVDGTSKVAGALAQRFVVKAPADWMVLAQ